MARLLPPVLAAVALHAALLAFFVDAYDGQLSALVCVSRERMGKAPYEVLDVGFGKWGYDGQFYYALARDPWHRHEAGLDSPAVRQVRILYPAASWLLSGGDAVRLLWAMPLVNLLAIGGLAWLGGAMALRHGLSAWWGFLLPLAVNAAYPALRNLTDVLSAFALCGLLVAWLWRVPWWVLGPCAAAALFCREINVGVVLILLAAAGWRREVGKALALGIPLMLWGAWVVALRLTYDTWPFLPSQSNLDLPLSGMLYCWTHLGPLGPRVLFNGACILHLTVQILLVAYLFWVRADRVLLLVALAGAAMALVGGIAVYEGPWSYMRVFTFLPLGLWLGFVQAQKRWPLVLLSTVLLLPVGEVVKSWLPNHSLRSLEVMNQGKAGSQG